MQIMRQHCFDPSYWNLTSIKVYTSTIISLQYYWDGLENLFYV